MTEKLPGLIAGLTGSDIPEYSFISPEAGKVNVDWDGSIFEASVFTDMVEPIGDGAREATYTNDVYAGCGALVSRKVGKGQAYYYGSAFNEASARVFLEKLGAINPYGDVIALPESCELAVRGKYAFVLNYLKAPAAIHLSRPMKDLLSGGTLQGDCILDDYGVLVLEI